MLYILLSVGLYKFIMSNFMSKYIKITVIIILFNFYFQKNSKKVN